MKNFFIVFTYLICLCSRCTSDDRVGSVKEWVFTTENGGVLKIDLMAGQRSGHNFFLRIRPTTKATVSVAEETKFLAEVYKQLPGISVHPENVRAIDMPGLRETDVKKRLAEAAVRSEKWCSAVKSGQGLNPALLGLLNSIGAYDELNTVFTKYGLMVRIGSVEKIAIEKQPQTHISGEHILCHTVP